MPAKVNEIIQKQASKVLIRKTPQVSAPFALSKQFHQIIEWKN